MSLHLRLGLDDRARHRQPAHSSASIHLPKPVGSRFRTATEPAGSVAANSRAPKALGQFRASRPCGCCCGCSATQPRFSTSYCYYSLIENRFEFQAYEPVTLFCHQMAELYEAVVSMRPTTLDSRSSSLRGFLVGESASEPVTLFGDVEGSICRIVGDWCGSMAGQAV